MRVIAGKYKGRQIKPPSGKQTRPTSDKIKEAVFHKMGPFFEGGRALDLFAGSGNLGIEALSRGLDSVVFVDQSGNALKSLKENCHWLDKEDTYKIYKNDGLKALHILAKKGHQFELLFIDPPYDYEGYQEILNVIHRFQLLVSDGLLYLEHQPNLTIEIPEKMSVVFERKYSATTAITILQKKI